MILISGNNLEKEFGAKKLFKNVNFEFHDNQKIGLVGNNGVGKSTLFKMITGEETIEKGTINYSHNLKIGYLEQQPKYDNMVVKDVLMSVFDELNGAGIVTAAKKVGRSYKIDADYCDVCKKMIFDTDVTGTSPEEGPKYYQY